LNGHRVTIVKRPHPENLKFLYFRHDK
jgi:hypothetical protein